MPNESHLTIPDNGSSAATPIFYSTRTGMLRKEELCLVIQALCHAIPMTHQSQSSNIEKLVKFLNFVAPPYLALKRLSYLM